MLGLASTVSSSSTPEFKYSLTFDGTDDYVSIDSLSAELSNDMAYSLSIWFKGDSNEGLQHENTLFSAHTSDGTNRFRIGVNHSGGVFYSDNGTGDHTIGSDDLDDGAWHNIIITRPAGSGDQQAKVYVDGGSAITANLDDSDPVWDDVALVSIGQEWDGDLSTSDFYQGKIYEVAFWSVQLDDASRTKVYNSGKPFNLTLNVGNYDNSSSLIGYWRMGNGSFDDKANGVIHDQNTAGFGSNVVTDGSFPSGTSAWTIRPSTTINGGSATITGLGSLTSTASNHSISQAVTGYTVGKSYKVTFTAKQLTGTGAMYGGIGYNNIFNQVVTSEYLTYTFYQTVSDDRGGVWENIVFGGVLATGGDTANTFEIKGISVKQLNGYPALTSDANGSGFNFSSDAP